MYGYVMYTFGQWIKIYRHLTMGRLPKRHVHSNFSKLLNAIYRPTTRLYTTFIKMTVISVFSVELSLFTVKYSNVNGLLYIFRM